VFLNFFILLGSLVPPTKDFSEHVKGIITKIHVSIIQPVNENHELVQKILEDCDYSLQKAIKAVEATRAISIGAAIEYITKSDMEESSNQLTEHEDLECDQ